MNKCFGILEEVRSLLHPHILGTEYEQHVYFAGGCVRDALLCEMGKHPLPEQSDIDLAVELPQGGIRLAEHLYRQGVSGKPVIYKRFGTAQIKVGRYHIELVMTRRESYRDDSRNPEVEFGSIREDVLRRDFTVNSLLMRLSDGEILDISGLGKDDLKAGIIRATSHPEVIFTEDPLRLLRAVRFCSRLQFALEQETGSYIRENAEEIERIVPERISAELKLMLAGKGWLEGIRLLCSTGLLGEINCLSTGKEAEHAMVWDNTFWQVQDMQPEAVPVLLRWLCLTRGITQVRFFLKRLRLSTALTGKVAGIHKVCAEFMGMAEHAVEEADFRMWAYRHRQWLHDMEFLPHLPLLWAGEEAKKVTITLLLERWTQLAEEWREKRFSLTGDDLISSFCLKPGAQIAELLLEAQAHWLFHTEAGKDELLLFLQERHPELVNNSR